MMLGALGSIGDGLMSLLTMLALSLTISDYGADYTSLPSQLVDKVTLSRPESVSMVILQSVSHILSFWFLYNMHSGF